MKYCRICRERINEDTDFECGSCDEFYCSDCIQEECDYECDFECDCGYIINYYLDCGCKKFDRNKSLMGEMENETNRIFQNDKKK